MATTTTITKMLFRRGNDADRKQTILASGEPGWTLDTKRLWIGDGNTPGGYPALSADEKHFNYDNGVDPSILRVDVPGLVETLALENVGGPHPGYFHATDVDINNYHNLYFGADTTSIVKKTGNGDLKLGTLPGHNIFLGNTDTANSNDYDQAWIKVSNPDANGNNPSKIILHAHTVQTEAIQAIEGTIQHTLFTDATIDMNVAREEGASEAKAPGQGRDAVETGFYLPHNNYLSAGRMRVGDNASGENSIELTPPVYKQKWDEDTGVTDGVTGGSNRTSNFTYGDKTYTMEHDGTTWTWDGAGSSVSLGFTPCKPLIFQSNRPDQYSGHAHLVFESGLIVYDNAGGPYNAYKINQDLDTRSSPSFAGITIEQGGDAIEVPSGGTGVKTLAAGGVIVAPHDSSTGPLSSAVLEAGQFLVGSNDGWKARTIDVVTESLELKVEDAVTGHIKLYNKCVPPGVDGHSIAYKDHFKKFMRVVAANTNASVLSASDHLSELTFKGDAWLVPDSNTLGGGNNVLYHHADLVEVEFDGVKAGSGANWKLGSTASATPSTHAISNLTFDPKGHIVGGHVTDLDDLYPKYAGMGTGGVDTKTPYAGPPTQPSSPAAGATAVTSIELNDYGTVKSWVEKDLNGSYMPKGAVATLNSGLEDAIKGGGSFHCGRAKELGNVDQTSWYHADNFLHLGKSTINQQFTNGNGKIAFGNRPLHFHGVQNTTTHEAGISFNTTDGLKFSSATKGFTFQHSIKASNGVVGNLTGIASKADTLKVNTYGGTDITCYLPFTPNNVSGDYDTLSTDADLYYDPVSNTLYAGNFVGDISGCTGIGGFLSGYLPLAGGNMTGPAAFLPNGAANLYFEHDGVSTSSKIIFRNDNPTGAGDLDVMLQPQDAGTTKPTIKVWGGGGDSKGYFNVYGEIWAEDYIWCSGSISSSKSLTVSSAGGGAADGAVIYNVLNVKKRTGVASSGAIIAEGGIQGGFLYGTGGTIGRDSRNRTIYGNNDKIRTYVNNVERMRLEADGDLHVDKDVIAYSATISDMRLKKSVKTIPNALAKITSLRGVEFDWKAGSRKNTHDLGVIAQEVEEIIPEIVREKRMSLLDNKVYKTVDYDKLVPLLIESVKELSAKVEKLEAQLK